MTSKRKASQAEPTPEKTAKVRYTGDGTRYVAGITIDPEAETEVPASRAAGLVETGLFEVVEGKQATATAAKEAQAQVAEANEAAAPETAPQGEETPA